MASRLVFTRHAVLFKGYGWANGVAEAVEQSEITGRISEERFSQSFAAVFVDGGEDLDRG